MYIEFETMQRELVIWLDNAEDILRELDQLKEDNEPSDDDINKFKVKCRNLLHCIYVCTFLYNLQTLVRETVKKSLYMNGSTVVELVAEHSFFNALYKYSLCTHVCIQYLQYLAYCKRSCMT